MTDLILQILKSHSRKNPATREELAQTTGLDERKCRDILADMRESGIPVISLNKGYFLADSEQDTQHYIRREIKKALTLLNRIKTFDRRIHAAIQQLEMPL